LLEGEELAVIVARQRIRCHSIAVVEPRTARFGSTLALLVLLPSEAGCGKSSVDRTSADAGAAASQTSPPALIEGRGITASHVWTWSPKNAHGAGGIAVETFVALTATAGYLRSPSTSVRLITTNGAHIAVDARQSTCSELLALGETRHCTFLFEIPATEKPERLEIHVAPEPAIAIAIANPPPTSGQCVADAPCTPCSFPNSGMECQDSARARGLEPACSLYEDAGLGRKVTLYCPPGYRRREPAPPP
jgi:hypothetical protein